VSVAILKSIRAADRASKVCPRYHEQRDWMIVVKQGGRPRSGNAVA